MGKTPRVGDYGGNAPLRRRSTSRAKVVDKVLSFRCRECESLRYVAWKELGRAARPRCLKCGGTLIETSPSESRRVERLDALAIARGERDGDEPKKVYRDEFKACDECGAKFSPSKRDFERDLLLHLNINPTCAAGHDQFHPTRFRILLKNLPTFRVRVLSHNKEITGNVGFGRAPVELLFTLPRATISVRLEFLAIQFPTEAAIVTPCGEFEMELTESVLIVPLGYRPILTNDRGHGRIEQFGWHGHPHHPEPEEFE